eukprot:3223511-Rhodomonas_salina.1
MVRVQCLVSRVQGLLLHLVEPRSEVCQPLLQLAPPVFGVGARDQMRTREGGGGCVEAVSYTHLRAHETEADL